MDHNLSFEIVVACTENGGIGRNGGLPWKIPKDLSYFRQLTTSTTHPLYKNAVIMGRKTWESLSMRPLSYRLNVIVSNTLFQTHENNVKYVKSLTDGLELVHNIESNEQYNDMISEYDSKIENCYIIGGAALYDEALNSQFINSCKAIHMTIVRGVPSDWCNVYSNRLREIISLNRTNIQNIKWESISNEFITDKDSSNHNELKTQLKTHMIQYGFHKLSSDSFFKAKSVPQSIVVLASPHEEYQYLDLIRKIINHGIRKDDRTGTGTLSIFGASMRFSLRQNAFPLLTTKRVFWRGVVEELLWFIRGETNSKTLSAKNIHIWDGNGSRAHLDAAGLTNYQEGELGPVYGWQWRRFGDEYAKSNFSDDDHSDDDHYRNDHKSDTSIDQLSEVIDMIRNNPNSRRIIMSAWNPCDLKKMALPPCHVMSQFYISNGELSCQMYQRSADMGLGVPFNIASYALLTCIIAHITGLKPGEFVHVIGDAHIYLNHVKPLETQIQREPKKFPTLNISQNVKWNDRTFHTYDNLIANFEDFKINDYLPHPRIEMEMSV